MKSLLQTLFFFLLLTQFCFGQWYPQNSGTTQHLNKVQFIDANTGWAVGDSGTIIYTTNAGATWLSKTTSTNANLYDVKFINSNVGWVIGDNGNEAGPPTESVILKTTNGGLYWINQMNDSTTWLRAGSFLDENIGWVICFESILKTTDGGDSWTICASQISGDFLRDIFFVDINNGFVSGWEGGIYKTTDGGTSWNMVFGQMFTWFNALSFTDAQNGIAVGAGGMRLWRGLIYTTTNSGIDWMSWMAEDFSSEFNDVYRSSTEIVNVVGLIFELGSMEKGIIMRSIDAGQTWSIQNIDSVPPLNGVSFIDDYIGWAVGNNGTILHTTNGGVTFLDNEPTQPTEFILDQNYPNPFNPSTTFSWQSPVGSHQTIKVYDVLGNEIATLIDEYKPAGKYEVEFNAASLPSGVYFYQLLVSALQSKDGKAGTFVETKKMILLR